MGRLVVLGVSLGAPAVAGERVALADASEQRDKTAVRKLLGTPSVFLQIFVREHQPFDTLVLREPVHNFGNVRQSDSTVKEMVRLDQNRHAARALIQTAAGTDSRL